MNINDKLQHFREVSMDNASMKKEALLKDFKQGVDFQCETHKKEADCKFELNKKSNIERIKREARRRGLQHSKQKQLDIIIRKHDRVVDILRVIK